MFIGRACRHLISLLLMLSLAAQGMALAAARGTAHFHQADAQPLLDTGRFDSTPRAHSHVLSDHSHLPGSLDVVKVAEPDGPQAGTAAKPSLRGLDGPAPTTLMLPEAPTLQQQFLNTRLAFSSHLEPPPLPPPRCADAR